MKRFELFFLALQAPLDFLLILAAGLSAYALRVSEPVAAWRTVLFRMELSSYLAVVTGVGTLWMVFFALAGLYAPDSNRRFVQELSRLLMGCLAGLSAVALYLLFSQQVFDSRFLVAATAAFAFVYLAAGRVAMRAFRRALYRRGVGRRRVFIVGEGGNAERLRHAFETSTALGYEVVGVCQHFDVQAEAEIARLAPDEILLADARAASWEPARIALFCSARHITLKYCADLFSACTAQASVYPIAGIPVVEVRRTPLDGWGRVVKRAMDIAGAIVLLAFASPIIALVVLAVWVESGHPIIYRNERLGRRGRQFFLLKFRSMRVEDCTGAQFGESGSAAEAREAALIAERSAKTGPIYKIANDPRVTRAGKFLRRWSVDELPQLWNVLAGTMSLVGPRPHQPREVAHYPEENRRVLLIRPGITGLAQVSGRSDLSFVEEARLDALYIGEWSVWLDLIILAKTPAALFRRRGVD